jgi:peptide/nickel transport system permease protein
LSRRAAGLASLVVLVSVHAAALAAGFFAPYDPAEQNRTMPFAPPTRVRLFEADGRFHGRPFVYALDEAAADGGRYEEDHTRACPVRLLVRGPSGGLRLFGVDDPARLFLLGTDGLGRDQLSRLLHGARTSLAAGLLATGVALGLGWLLGVAAGYYRGWVDAVVMRAVELFLALPWLYLLFGVRALLPLHVPPGRAFLMIVLVIGLVDWARPARVFRGLVLSARERGYVLAARGFGASDAFVIRRHIAPATFAVAATQAALLVPQYVLAEVTLSFLGLGIGEAAPSWGNMLSALQQYHVLVSYWWMWLPGLALVPVLLAWSALADAVAPPEEAAA